SIHVIYPLSLIQNGMIFHTLYAPGSGVYFQQYKCVIEGDLQIAALERAWEQLIEHHSVLRTSFVWEGRDKPLQIISRRISFPWTYLDWNELSAEEQERKWQQLSADDRARGFNLSKAPLIRLTLIKLADRRYNFLWSYHHALLDGWSIILLLEEVALLYYACSQGRNIQLRRPRPFREYIAWLRQQDTSRAENFWRRQLRGFTEPTP